MSSFLVPLLALIVSCRPSFVFSFFKLLLLRFLTPRLRWIGLCTPSLFCATVIRLTSSSSSWSQPLINTSDSIRLLTSRSVASHCFRYGGNLSRHAGPRRPHLSHLSIFSLASDTKAGLAESQADSEPGARQYREASASSREGFCTVKFGKLNTPYDEINEPLVL